MMKSFSLLAACRPSLAVAPVALFSLALAPLMMASTALAETTPRQFVPPGGLPISTPVGTAGITLQTMQRGISQNASDIEALGKNSVTPRDLSSALSPYLTQDKAGATYLPLGGGTLTGRVTTPGDPAKGGIIMTDPLNAGKSSKISYNANSGELTIENNTAVNNALALKTTDMNGFAALAFAGPDMAYDGIFEHGAVGWGPNLKWGPDNGYDYFEISRFGYGGNFSRTPVPFLWQTTGSELIPWGLTTAYGVVTKGSPTITCVGGCNFASGTGQILDSPAEYGLFPAGTTVVSGAGTNTITLSKAALASSADATAGTYLRFGVPEGSQHDWMTITPMGNVDYRRFGDAKWGVYTNKPFFSIDRVNGRVGVNNPLPAAPIDVSGAILANISGVSSLNSFSTKGALNAQVSPGTAGQNTVLHAYAPGVNQFNMNWEANPQRVVMQDSNTNASVFDFRMDGSWQSQQYAHPVDNVTADLTLNGTDKCGRTLLVNSSSAVTITVPPYRLTGCRITITQAGTGAVSIAPGAGMTLGWYATQPQTGTYTLPGQYASAVVEAKSTFLATIERGQ